MIDDQKELINLNQGILTEWSYNQRYYGAWIAKSIVTIREKETTQ